METNVKNYDRKEANDAVRGHLAVCVVVWLVMYMLPALMLSFVFTNLYDTWINPLIIGGAFSAVEILGVTWLWKWVVTKHIDYHSLFQTAVSGFRMLAVIGIFTIIYIAVGREGMLPYFVCILYFYIACIVLHSVFFAQQAKKIYEKD